MAQKRKKLTKRLIAVIAVAALCFITGLALLITNFFIPVKYLTAYCVAADKNEERTLRVSFIDVGYGDCTVAEFPDGKTLLIDGGNGTYSNNLKVLTALNARGIDTIDYLICSSPAAERCGGLAEVLKYKNVVKVFAPKLAATYINDSFRNFSVALDGAGITAGDIGYGAGVFNDEYGYNFCMLSPSAISLSGGNYGDMLSNPTAANINNASAVVWIEYSGAGFLLLGNVSAEVQENLFKGNSGVFEINGRTVDISNCAVLKLANHGAGISAYNIYPSAKPQIAVLSVGDNGTGCPSVAAVSYAQNWVGGNFYRTDIDGSVTVTVRNARVEVEKEKK
ncbi:MAG: hypothetical protein K2N30_00930 [Clostridia bacterium]|nr:hypothetical protein [Clostridia bacterium]